MNVARVLAVIAAATTGLLCGCVTSPAKRDFTAFNTAAPRSVLVVPAVNRSLDVDAANLLLSSLTIPLAEKGFYVFPVNTTKIVLEQEGLYDGDLVHQQPPESLAGMFGADAILYMTINRWDAQYLVLAAAVTVELDYRMVLRDGTELWKERQQVVFRPNNNNAGNGIAGLVSAVISAAVARAAPNYRPLVKQANDQAFVNGPGAIPNGPYRKVAGK